MHCQFVCARMHITDGWMAAENVITTTNMCIGTHARLMAAEKVFTVTTKICMWKRMHVKTHGGQMRVMTHIITRIFPDVTFAQH